MFTKHNGKPLAAILTTALLFAVLTINGCVDKGDVATGIAAAAAVVTVKEGIPKAEQIVAKMQLSDADIVTVAKAKTRLSGAAARFTQLVKPSNFTTKDGRNQLKDSLLIDYKSTLNDTIAALKAAHDVITSAIDSGAEITDAEKRELRQLWAALGTLRVTAERAVEEGQVVQAYVNFARFLADTVPAMLPGRS